MELEISYKNEYGERFTTSREVDEDWAGLDELEFLQDTYKNFLNNLGYALSKEDKVVILHENEYIEEYCDGDCENCEENEDKYIDDYGELIDADEEISGILKDHAKEIADIVATEFNKSAQTRGYRASINPID